MTENWRVKIATRFAPTLRGNFGSRRISLPFSRTEETWIA